MDLKLTRISRDNNIIIVIHIVVRYEIKTIGRYLNVFLMVLIKLLVAENFR